MFPAATVAGATAVAAALVVLAARSHDRAYWLYGHASYWCMLGLVLAFAATAFAVLPSSFSWREFFRRRRLAALTGLAAAALVFCASPPRFRVLSDETNLLGVAASMSLEKTTYNPTIAKRYYGALHPLNREIEKRAFLFPFLIHVAHTITGQRWQNGFVVNFVLLAALLAVIFACAADAAGLTAAGASVVLVAGYPLVALCATSAGQELLCAALFVSVMLALRRYLREPSAEGWAWLWVNALAFAHTRYECILIAALALAAGWAWRPPRWDWLARFWPLYAATPLLALPAAWQRILVPNPCEPAPGEAAFSAGHFVKFAGLFLKTQLKPYDPLVPHAVALNWVSIGCGAALATHRLRGGPPFDRRRAWWLGAAAVCLGAHATIFFFNHFGDYVHPASARYFLALSIAGALVPAAYHAAYPDRLPRGWLAAIAAASLLVYFPIAGTGQHTDTLELVRETREAHRFVLGRADEHALYLYSRPGQITVLDYGAGDFAWANRSAGELLLELDRHLFTDIFALQRVSYETDRPLDSERLDPKFRLEPVSEIQTSAGETLRISRVLRD